MSEQKHAPGPWVVDARHVGDVQTSSGEEICSAWSKDNVGETMTIQGKIPWSYDVQEANARLIAAAPELLGALILAERWLAPVGVPVSVIATIDVAIAKATGKSQ